jgi:hypothetical protein
MTVFLLFPGFYVFWNGASFSTRGGVWLLLVTPLLGSDSVGAHSHSLLFCPLTPTALPFQPNPITELLILVIHPRHGPHRKRLFHYCVFRRRRGNKRPQSCSLAAAVVLSPVFTAVTSQWVYMSQYSLHFSLAACFSWFFWLAYFSNMKMATTCSSETLSSFWTTIISAEFYAKINLFLHCLKPCLQALHHPQFVNHWFRP